MPRTRVRQDEQIHASEVYDDTVAPTEANYETNPTSLQEDINNLRSLSLYLKNRQQSGNWFDVLATPSTFTGEGEGPRAVDDLNQDLWDLQRKRVLVAAAAAADVAVPASQNYVILGAGELPPNPTAAVGAVTTRGTVVVTHGGTFGSHDLTEVPGSTAISPKNLVEVVDATTRDPIKDSSDRRIWGLLQGESGLVDGDTIETTTDNRVQVSFVVLNSTGDDLVACAVSDIESTSVNIIFQERKALENLTEQDFLRGAITDVPSGATTTREQAYNNQGTAPVDLTTNATLDLEGAGLIWAIRDDLEATLFRVIEGSAGGTSEVEIAGDVDIFDVDAPDVDFDAGISVATGKTRPIDIGETDGVVESTAGDLEVQAAAELVLSDGNESAGWSRNGILLSDTSTEWDDFESEFGEVSLLAAIVSAKQNTERVSGWANVNQNIPANTLIDGSGGTPNITAQLPSYKGLTFVDQVEVFINRVKQRPGADASANNDVYPSAVSGEQAVGAFYCEYNLAYQGGTNPDNINMVVYGQPDP